MVIPDMLKNAPMFKRLDARIKVSFHFYSMIMLLILYLFDLADQLFCELLEG